MTFEVAICLDDIGANTLIDPLTIYGNSDFYLSAITTTTLSQLTPPNCPLILNNIPDGTTTLKIVDSKNLCAQIEIQEPPFFHFVVDTTKPGSNPNQITLPLINNGQYDIYVDWGDNGPWDNIKTWNDPKKIHTYTTSGTYEIKIYSFPGNFVGWNYYVDPLDRRKITEVLRWGPIQLGNTKGQFSACSNLNLTNVVDTLNTSGLTKFDSMFELCTSLTSINNVNGWNTSGIYSMNSTFKDAISFNSDLSGWTTNNVTDMTGMFERAKQFNKNIGNWKTYSCKSMSAMFAEATNFDNLGDNSINNWDTSQVTAMNYMFYKASSFNRNIGNWNVSKVTEFGYMFSDATSFNNHGSNTINNWNTKSAKNMGHMFHRAFNFNQPVGNFDVSKVDTCCGNSNGLRSTFDSAIIFNQDLSSWDTKNVKTFEKMFNGALVFNNLGSPHISGWTTSAVTNMAGVFLNAKQFNQYIGSWNVSGVTNMESMFEGASVFNKDIGNWNTKNVNNMVKMFKNAFDFNQNIGSWDIKSLTNATEMFYNASDFNQDIKSWEPINVTNLTYFISATTFSVTNYNNLLTNWSSLTLKPNVTMTVSQNYNSSVASFRNILTNAPNNWTIIDFGQI